MKNFLNLLFSCKGELDRRKYFEANLWLLLFSVLAGVIFFWIIDFLNFNILTFQIQINIPFYQRFVLFFLLFFILIIVALTQVSFVVITIKRLRDTGQNVGWILLLFISLFSWKLLIITFMFLIFCLVAPTKTQ